MPKAPGTRGNQVRFLALPAREVGFKGPLNLLTTLARREELDVLELSLADLVDSFRGERESEQDLERLGEFLTGLGFLLRRKIRGIFPSAEIPEEPAEEPEPEPEPVLVSAVAFLEGRWSSSRLLYGRRPPVPARRVWTEAGVESLAALASTLPAPLPEPPVLPSLWLERRPLEEEISELTARLKAEGQVWLPGSLEAAGLGEFLGALELGRRREADLSQEEVFGPIAVVAVGDGARTVPLDVT